ncbi:MAG: hypothetical protein JWM93_3683 [Frankiales bacterium]|nr:hypothetical protein [Frankiales bacterium]
MIALLAPADGAPPISRDDAARAARDELRHAIYRDQQSWLDRALGRLGRWLTRVMTPDPPSPGSSTQWVAIVLVVGLLLALIVAIAWRAGKLQHNVKRAEVLHFDRTMSAAEHRARADQHAVAAQWREAVRERLRATVRELEERGLLDERPGRTATEIAAEASSVLPALGTDLGLATRTFADVWYGDRDAGPATDAAMRAVDDRVRDALRQRVRT